MSQSPVDKKSSAAPVSANDPDRNFGIESGSHHKAATPSTIAKVDMIRNRLCPIISIDSSPQNER
jgi:hypothetical protein